MADVFLYAGMNVFLAAPVACDLGMRAKTSGAAACAAASAAIGASIAVILAAVFAAGSVSSEVPLLSALGGVAEKVFAAVSAFGIVTTLFSAYYPLHERARASAHPLARQALVCAAAFLVSRLGLRAIVSHIYPLLGGAGLLFLCACAAARLRARRGCVFAVRVKKRCGRACGNADL